MNTERTATLKKLEEIINNNIRKFVKK